MLKAFKENSFLSINCMKKSQSNDLPLHLINYSGKVPQKMFSESYLTKIALQGNVLR